jgi:GntR family transcriptional regulator
METEGNTSGVLSQHGIPLYHQLKEIFTEKIASDEWKVGETIPNELLLCRYYGVSRGPVRQALALLVREGLLTRKQGRGTQVLPPKIESDLGGFYSFTTLIRDRGMHPSVQLLAFDTVPAEGSVAQALNLPTGSPCLKIRRLRLADQKPLILETVFVPESVCSGLTEDDVIARSLYDTLTTRYGVVLQRQKHFFEPTIADEYEARILDIPEGAPVLLLQNITYAVGDRPVVIGKAIMRGDRVRYYVELTTQISKPLDVGSVDAAGFQTAAPYVPAARIAGER